MSNSLGFRKIGAATLTALLPLAMGSYGVGFSRSPRR
jgi:hypothetical protein